MKKCAVINDLSGFGKCSLTAAIPIMSAMGVEVHPLLTAVLSNQTAYESFKSLSLTDTMKPFIEEWKKLGAKFDGILTGFVTDKAQLEIISDFIDEFKDENTLVVADLAILAHKGNPDVLNEKWVNDYSNIEKSLNMLYKKGLSKIVVTGYKENGAISNIIFDNGEISKVTNEKVGGYFSGKSLAEACKCAGEFITNTIKVTDVSDGNDGIAFEKTIGELISYE